MSDARRRLESAALVAAFLLVAAFIASAVFGVARRPDAEPVAQTPSKPLPAAPGKLLGRVEVLNATGRSGLARAATEQLRDAGYDVVFFGTNRVNTDSSVVLDRSGRPDIASGIASALGVTAIRTQKDTTLLLDATVIVGNDWKKRQVEAGTAETGWRAKLKQWLK